MQNVRLKIIVLACALAGVLFLKNCVSWKQALPFEEEPASDQPATEVTPDAAPRPLE